MRTEIGGIETVRSVEIYFKQLLPKVLNNHKELNHNNCLDNSIQSR